MKNKLRKELNPLNSLIKEQRRAIDALKNPWGDVAKIANPAYFFLEEQRKLKEALSDPFKEMRKMARIDSAFLNTSQIYKELTCSAVHLEALSNPLAGYMQALAEALQSATRLVGVDNLSQYFSDMEHRIALLDKDYLKDLIYPMSRIEEYSQSLSNTLFNNDLLNVTSFSAIHAINEQLLYYQQYPSITHNLEDSSFYNFLKNINDVYDDLDEEEREKERWSIINNYLADLIDFLSTKSTVLLWRIEGIKLLDYVFAIAVSYFFFSLSASDADMQTLNRKVDEIIALFDNNHEHTYMPAVIYKTTDTLRVYAEVDTDTVISIVPKNELVTAIAQNGQWMQIQFVDHVFRELKIGWVKKQYLEPIETLKNPRDLPNRSPTDEAMTHFQASLEQNRRLGELLAK